MRSRGAILFSQLGSKQVELSQRLGVGMGTIAMWQTGDRKPGLANRKLLLNRFKIPIEAWDEEPATPLATPAPASRPPPVAWGERSVRVIIEDTERTIDEMLSRVNDPNLTLLEQSRVLDRLLRMLDKLMRMRGEAVPEPDVVRHPKWLGMRDGIVAALEGHPEALSAVVASLAADEEKTA